MRRNKQARTAEALARRREKVRRKRAEHAAEILARIRHLAAHGYLQWEIAEKLGIPVHSVAARASGGGLEPIARRKRPPKPVKAPRVERPQQAKPEIVPPPIEPIIIAPTTDERWAGLLAGMDYENDPTALPSEGPWRRPPPMMSSTGQSSMAWAG